jgi:hypothetical protein
MAEPEAAADSLWPGGRGNSCGAAEGGAVFPDRATVRADDRATEVRQRWIGLKIHAVTLRSYRSAWAERAKVAGYPYRAIV